jgi:hypothetical protein
MSPCPSGTIQEQIDCLQQSIDDLTYSPSGVNMYTGTQTIDDYDEVWARTMRDFNEGVNALNEGIIEASGLLRIINNGLLFHRH